MKYFFRSFGIMLLFLFCQKIQAQNDFYKDSIQRHRVRTDSVFKYGAESPLKTDSQKHEFTHLNYFPTDPQYVVKARFVRIENPEKVKFKTSSEKVKEYLKYARLEFTLHGKPQTMYAYFSETLAKKEEYRDYLFIPFTDLSNGAETYGGGRYIEGRIPEGDTMILDFNLCFNPYCHYSDGYSCPKVPSDNHIPLRIEAGEKLLYIY